MLENFTFVYFEDDAPSRLIMEMMLVEELGIRHVHILEDSQHFLEVIEELRPLPDIFLLDIHIKPYSGFDMLNLIRQHSLFHKALVVALTASVMSDEVQMLRTAGFDGVIPKPIDPDAFPGTLERLISGEKVWRIS